MERETRGRIPSSQTAVCEVLENEIELADREWFQASGARLER